MEATQSGKQTIVIEPAKAWPRLNLREILDHRDLIYYLARRDTVVRYKQAIVGVFWAVVQPLLLAGVFTLFLGQLADIPSEKGIPYPLFAVSGLVMWLFFTGAVLAASNSTIESEALISKIYFPRAVLPTAAVFPSVVDFAFGFVVVLAISLAYGFVPSWTIIAVPIAAGLATLTALGFGLWFSGLNVKYRDVTLVVPFLTLVGLFITPITYPSVLIPDALLPLYNLNPMVGVLELFRWGLFHTSFPGLILLIPITTSLIALVTGAFYFKRAEQSFADYI